MSHQISTPHDHLRTIAELFDTYVSGPTEDGLVATATLNAIKPLFKAHNALVAALEDVLNPYAVGECLAMDTPHLGDACSTHPELTGQHCFLCKARAALALTKEA